jgi:hypothetical protein
MIDVNTYATIGLHDDVRLGDVTVDDLVQPRFWEMRRFIVDFGRLMNMNADIERGDAVYITNGFGDEGDGPWLLSTIDDKNGYYTLINDAGQILRCPMRASSMLLFKDVLRLSR